MKQNEFMCVAETNKTFEETVVLVLKAVEQKGWALFQVYDIKERLAAKGFEADPLKIIEICSGKYASQLLKKNVLVSLCMPCKINVLMEGGAVKVAAMNPRVISQFFSGVDDKIVEQIEREIREIVDMAADRKK